MTEVNITPTMANSEKPRRTSETTFTVSMTPQITVNATNEETNSPWLISLGLFRFRAIMRTALTSRMSYRRRKTAGASLAERLSQIQGLAAVSSIRLVGR